MQIGCICSLYIHTYMPIHSYSYLFIPFDYRMFQFRLYLNHLLTIYVPINI